MRLSFAFLLVVVWFAGCGSGPSASCESTSDCRSGRMCIDGRCELVPDTAFVDAPGTETDGGGSETDGGELFDGGLPVEGGGSASAPDADGDAISDAQEGRATRPRAG